MMIRTFRWTTLTLLLIGAIGCGDRGDRALKEFESTVANIDKESAGTGYSATNTFGLGLVRYAGPRVAAHPDGRLRVDVRYCRYEVSIDFENPEKSNAPDSEMVKEDKDCILADAMGISVSLATLQGVDPEAIDVHGFMEDGTSVTELEMMALQLPPEEIYSLADSFAIIAWCRDEVDCVEYVDAGEGPRLFIPCANRKSCGKIQRDLRLLTKFAVGPEFSRVAKALADKGYPKTVINNDRQAKKAAARIAKRLGFSGWFDIDLNTGEKVSVMTTSAEYRGDGVLSFEAVYDIRAPGRSGAATANGENRIDLSQIDIQSIMLPIHSDRSGWVVVLECETASCVESQAGDLYFAQNGSIVPCKDEEDCRDITRDLRGLAVYAASKSKPADHKKRADGNDSASASAQGDAPRPMRRHAEDLAEAVKGSELRLSVSEGPMRRIMRGKGASVDGNFTLTVERDVCVALLPVDRPQWNGCEMESLFNDYALEIDLAGLDPGTIASRSADVNAGERGLWLSLSCAPAQACAEIGIPVDAHHSAKLQIETLMRSFREDRTAPFIRMPCRDEAACKRAEKALRGLVKEANKRAPKRKRRRGGDLVGVWELRSEHQTGWVTEFRANGEFVFTNPTSRTEGTYTAKDGKWSQRASQYNFEDQGAYRFFDEDMLELTGKYGVSVWTRRAS